MSLTRTRRDKSTSKEQDWLSMSSSVSRPFQISFTSGSASLLLFRDKDTSRIVPSTSPSDVSVHGRNILTMPCNSFVDPSYPAETIQSYTPRGDKLNTMMADCERVFTKPSNYLNANEPSSSAAQCKSFQPNKRLSCLSSTVQHKSYCINQRDGSNTIDLNSRLYGRIQYEENPEVSQTNEDPVESECCQENGRVVRVGNLCGHEDISAVGISPDDVIGVIGEKQFCETRKAIINQQRVFAVQVFELHRLIKVQSLIARSPHLLFEGNDFWRKAAVEVPPTRKVQLERDLLLPPLIVEPNDHPQKPNSSTECAEESSAGKFPLPSVNSSRGLNTHQSNYGQYSTNAPLASGATNVKPALWCLQPPPGNLWFVPVTSPSEGLAYKPYTGPCPPSGGGFMSPMHGSCDPASLNIGIKDYLNAAYGVPSSYQQGMGIGTPPFLPTYFPPYGMPITNPSSSSAVENMSRFSGGQSNGQEIRLSYGEIKFTMPHQSSCNMPSQMGQVMPYHARNVQVLKGSELQGSIATTPSDRTIGNALPLFPMTPQSPKLQEPAQNAQTSEHQTPAIKVVPHYTKSASESAARIFLSIQEERK